MTELYYYPQQIATEAYTVTVQYCEGDEGRSQGNDQGNSKAAAQSAARQERRSRGVTLPPDIDWLMLEYQCVYGFKMARTVISEMRRMMEKIDAAVIFKAIEASRFIPYPSWHYARKIVYRCIEEGVKTAEDYDERQAKHGRKMKEDREYWSDPNTF